MDTRISALLVHHDADHFRALESALQRQRIKTFRVETCEETSRVIEGPEPPHLVFTDRALPDGRWQDVVALAFRADHPFHVIVVAPVVDIPLYIEVLERGAFDFIAPPIADADLAYIVHGATSDVLRRRDREAALAEHAGATLLGPPALLPRASVGAGKK